MYINVCIYVFPKSGNNKIKLFCLIFFYCLFVFSRFIMDYFFFKKSKEKNELIEKAVSFSLIFFCFPKSANKWQKIF